MLEDQPPARFEQPFLPNEFGDRFTSLDVIRRIGEDDIELFGTAFQVEKGVRLYRINLGKPERLGRTADVVIMYRVNFDRNDAPCPARCEFVTDGPRSREKVEDIYPFDLPMAGNYVEQVLLGEVRRGTGAQILRRLDDPDPVTSANDPLRNSILYCCGLFPRCAKLWEG